jgi:hypothetical protein
MGVRGDGSASASAQDKVVGAEIFLEAVRPYGRQLRPTFWTSVEGNTPYFLVEGKDIFCGKTP